MFLQELKNFSKQNWWIYILFAIAIGIVGLTGKGNMFEIMILFLINLIANIFIMGAIGNYSGNKNKIGAIFHFTGTSLFTLLGLYAFIYKGQSQYLIWQVCFLIAAIKAVTFYNFNKDIKLFNSITVGLLNIIFLGIFIYASINPINIFGYNFSTFCSVGTIALAIGFSLVTTGLVSTNDNFRYWLNYLGAIGIIIGSGLLTYQSYQSGNLNGVDLGFFILNLTSLSYFSKLLPQYIKKLKIKK